MDRKEYIESLRRRADLYEQHPELPLPFEAEKQYVYINRDYSLDLVAGKKDIRERLAKIARALGGRIKKDFSDDYFTLEVPITANSSFHIYADRDQVCERVQVGTKITPPEPAKEAIPEHEMPVYQWVCKDPILSAVVERIEHEKEQV